MTYLSEAHSEWHIVNPSTPWNCPLDCGAGESYDPTEGWTDEDFAEYEAWATESEAERMATTSAATDLWGIPDPDFFPGGPDFSEPPF